jgi:hypothetical protein
MARCHFPTSILLRASCVRTGSLLRVTTRPVSCGHRYAIARDSFWKFHFQCATWETKHESEEVAGSNPVVLDVHAPRMQLQHLVVKVTRRCGRLDESVEVADVLPSPLDDAEWSSLPGRRQPNRWSAPTRLIRGEIGPYNELMMDANQKWGVIEAIERTKELAELDPWWMEEPLLNNDVDVAMHR